MKRILFYAKCYKKYLKFNIKLIVHLKVGKIKNCPLCDLENICNFSDSLSLAKGQNKEFFQEIILFGDVSVVYATIFMPQTTI